MARVTAFARSVDKYRCSMKPRLVVFDHGQCVEIAHRAEQFAGLVVLARFDPGDERLED